MSLFFFKSVVNSPKLMLYNHSLEKPSLEGFCLQVTCSVMLPWGLCYSFEGLYFTLIGHGSLVGSLQQEKELFKNNPFKNST